jgi:NADPH-dependent glutamate synthase beta subunit-like oxidoreductase
MGIIDEPSGVYCDHHDAVVYCPACRMHVDLPKHGDAIRREVWERMSKECRHVCHSKGLQCGRRCDNSCAQLRCTSDKFLCCFEQCPLMGGEEK